MLLDIYGFIVMEQCAYPGSIGDSAAETGRYVTLMYFNKDIKHIDLSNFITPKGILRHPESPWREDDTSGDQVAPLIAASALLQPKVADIIIKKIRDNNYRTGNNNLINPGILANIKRHEGSIIQGLYDLAFLGQGLLLKLPYRWSESKKTFEKMEESSADYLNLFNSLFLAKIRGGLTLPQKLTLKLLSKEHVLNKIKSYYKVEPNSEFLIKEYEKALEVLYDV